MKSLLTAVFLLTTLTLYAQSSTAFFDHESDYYQVRSQVDIENAREIGSRLDAYIRYFTDLFHFDLDDLEYKLGVRVFGDQEAYTSYLTTLIDESREDFVYLHNSNPERSELVGAITDSSGLDQSFTHQAFIQFLRAFINNPPLWLREGFAIYFEDIQFDSGQIIPGNDSSWLITLREILTGDRSAEALSLQNLLLIDLPTAKEEIEVFYPQSWGIVYYLLNTDVKEHRRIIWDAINSLDPDADLATNSRDIFQKTFQWVDIDDFQQNSNGYFEALKTPRELIEAGVNDYELGDFESATANLLKSIERQNDNYIPYYYLGLIDYNQSNNESARAYYMQAIEKGQDDALVYYALGLNAFTDKQYDEAIEYFDTAVELDPEKFTERVKDIRARIEG